LAAHFPGVNNTIVWTDPAAGSQIEFDSFVHLARTAECGLFDFLFLVKGLRLREHRGQIYDLDVVGRPDTFTVLAALAAVTDRLGLIGTINTTFNEPFEVHGNSQRWTTCPMVGRAGTWSGAWHVSHRVHRSHAAVSLRSAGRTLAVVLPDGGSTQVTLSSYHMTLASVLQRPPVEQFSQRTLEPVSNP
jgi:hypothetical protein